MQVSRIDFKAANASLAFTNSLRQTGFAVIENHPIDYSLVQEVFREWAEFFNSDYKENYLYNNDTQDGFFPMRISEKAVGYDVRDIKEFFHYYSFGQYPDELSNKTKQLYQQMVTVSITFLQWIEKHLPPEVQIQLSEPLSQMIKDSTEIVMRILHYPPLTGNEETNAVRAAAHVDSNLLTTLVAASQAGLQVQDAKGNWLEVPVDPGMLSINIGDMLEEITAGYYKPTLHRVVNPENEDRFKSRYSIPLFLHPRSEVRLSKQHTQKSFLDARFAITGVKK